MARPNLKGAFDSPVRNLILGVAFTLAIMVLAILAYISQRWSLRDALYMVVLTVFTVG